MVNIRIQTHRKGMTEVLTSSGVLDEIDKQAKHVASTANGMHNAKGYAGDAIVGSGSKPRAHDMVKTTDLHAKRSNGKHNTLLKALRGG